MGRTHGLSGLAAGLALGAWQGLPVVDTALLAGVTMLGAYVPDIDHRGSTITRGVPVVGRVASWVVRGASRAVYAATKGAEDEDCSGEHRHLSHTVVFAVVLGAVAGWVVALVGGAHLGWLVGLGLAAGCVAHCLGDALTCSGCPFLWPLPIRGETWFELRPPRFLRFRTGGPVETFLVAPALTVACVLLAPGVWPVIGPVVEAALR